MGMTGVLYALAAMLMFAPLCSSGTVVFDFQNTDGFEFTNYCDRLMFETRNHEGERAVVFKNESRPAIDTFWSVTTPLIPVGAGKTYVVKVRTRSDVCMKNTKPMSAIHWYSSKDKVLLAQDVLGQDSPVATPMPIRTSPTSYRDSMVSGVVPEGASFAKIRICMDWPNLKKGQVTAISRIEYVEKKDGETWAFEDLVPPKVERLTPSPALDFLSPVSFRISDASGISKVAISLDGTDITERVVFAGNIATYSPSVPWEEDSIHEFRLSVEDKCGNDDLVSRFVCFTRSKVLHEKISIRDDSTILRDGKPFFPIAIWGVKPHPLHGNNIDRTVKELKAAGFNLLSTYMSFHEKSGQELVSSCNREGIKVFFEPGPRNGKNRDAIIRASIFAGRSQPSVFGWCIGDDTSSHRMPDEVARDYELIKAVDPLAVSGHADGCNVSGKIAGFAPWTEMFVGEMYPIRGEQPEADELTKIQKSMLIGYADLQTGGSPSPYVLPLLQSFKGWGNWHRYPTEEEIRAMTFLAIACKARGIAYYTYAPGDNRNCGVTSSPERFAEIERVAREVSALSPQLLMRDATVQPEVRITEGPRTASFGFPSVKALMKENGLLIAVNISTETVKAALSLPTGLKREMTLGRNGVFVGKFESQK